MVEWLERLGYGAESRRKASVRGSGGGVWSGGAMVLGKLPVLLVLIRVGQGPTALAVGAGGGCLDIFTLIYSFSPLSPSLWEAARYRLKYCLKGPLKPNQPTNQPSRLGFGMRRLENSLCQPSSKWVSFSN